MDQTEVRAWMAKRSQQDGWLYDRYGRALEPEHHGEFVAIADDGRLIVGVDQLDVVRRAVQQFGSGSFALRRIGTEAEIRWRRYDR